MGEEEDRAQEEEEEEEAGEIGEGEEQEEEEESPRLTSARTGKILSIRYERLPRSAIRTPARTTRIVGRIHARMHARACTFLCPTRARPAARLLFKTFPFIVSTMRSVARGQNDRQGLRFFLLLLLLLPATRC